MAAGPGPLPPPPDQSCSATNNSARISAWAVNGRKQAAAPRHLTHAQRTTAGRGVHVLVAVRKGATFLPAPSANLRRAFLSFHMVSERSSPSRVRFAAPNNGAPFDRCGPFQEALPERRERLDIDGLRALSVPPLPFWPLFWLPSIRTWRGFANYPAKPAGAKAGAKRRTLAVTRE